MNFRDAELISAYLDRQLDTHDSQLLEGRLAADAELRTLLEDMRLSRQVLQKSPRRRAPHNFTLQPQMRQLRGPEPRAVPLLRLASALAGLLLVATLAFNGLAQSGAMTLASAPVPAYGVGGGGAGESTEEQPLQSFAAPAAPEGTATAATQSPQDLGAPTALARAEAAPKQAPPAAGAIPTTGVAAKAQVPAIWQLGLGAFALVCGWLAWYVHQRARRNFRSRWLEK